MSRPVFLGAPGSLDAAATGSVLTLAGPEGRHAATVRRLRVGEEIDLVDGVGGRARGVVVAVRPDAVDVQVRGVEREVADAVGIVLVQALAKGDRDELAVEAATELGVAAVTPWQAERSVSVWSGPKVERGVRRWEAVVAAAAKQARRARVPAVRSLVRGRAIVDVAARTIADGGAVVVLHEEARRPLRDVALPASGEVLVVVGPEGGLSDAEVHALEAAGAQVARLGPHVLRTSTAGPVAVALLADRLGHWEPDRGTGAGAAG